VTDVQVRALLDRIARAMAKMTAAQRELVVRRILERDPDLEPALPTLISTIHNTKRMRCRSGETRSAGR